jgi:hypothetical protein
MCRSASTGRVSAWALAGFLSSLVGFWFLLQGKKKRMKE